MHYRKELSLLTAFLIKRKKASLIKREASFSVMKLVYFWISSNSTSKTKVEKGLIAPMSFAPYANDSGI